MFDQGLTSVENSIKIAQRLFRIYDQENKGYLTIQNVQQIRQDLYSVVNKQYDYNDTDNQLYLQVLDTDSDGRVTLKDLENFVIQTFGQKKPEIVYQQRPSLDTQNFSARNSLNQRVSNLFSGTRKANTYNKSQKEQLVKNLIILLDQDSTMTQKFNISPYSEQIFDQFLDGILPCKLINCIKPGTIEDNAIHKFIPLNRKQQIENINLAVNSAKSIGCQFNKTIMNYIQEREPVILEFIGSLIKRQILYDINLKNYPSIINLIEQNEEADDLLQLTPEQIIIRWINFHLKNSSLFTNFNQDLKDGEIYSNLFNQIDPIFDINILQNQQEKIQNILNYARQLQIDPIISNNDIINGDYLLNLLFCAQIFKAKNGLSNENQEIKNLNFIEENQEDQSDEQCIRLWCNSLNIEDFNIQNLYSDFRDGLALLRIIDQLKKNSVDWKQVEMKPNNKFKKLSNTNLAVKILKEKFGLNLVNIGGVDIHNGEKKLVLALMWQLKFYHILKEIKHNNNYQIGQIKEFNNNSKQKILETKILEIVNFYQIFYKVLIKKYQLMLICTFDNDLLKKAKLTLSLARKVGAQIYIQSQDIYNVKQNSIVILVASIAYLIENQQEL